MFVSMNWIKEYVDLSGFDIEELIHRFTLSTAEVEGVIYKGRDLKDVVCGKVISFEKHPESKKLHLLKIDAGDRVYDCVCGAPNVSLNQKVAFVRAGGRVPGGEISKCTVAGYPSEGMCCSEAELGISDDHTGIMEFDEDLPVGCNLKEKYAIEDIVFEVDNKSLTNRPDLWGHYGIAREFSALTGRELKPLELEKPEYSGEEKIPVNILRNDLVYRYSCVKLENISRQKSPLDMRIKLYYCGMRGINFLADLTNYVMLELGQPMHAFDANKISSISVGTPKEEMKFITLDGAERDIDKDTLMIYNGEEPVAVAGIMGGLDSEIIDGTSAVVLESANFDGISVRKSSSRLGLRTDASMRYEKILDPELCKTALERFVKLLLSNDEGAKAASQITDEYVKKYDAVELKFDKGYVDRYTGIDISCEQIIKTLSQLGFGCEYSNGEFKVDVPTWRATKDVTIKADIIEEITRIYGYDNFEIKTTKSSLRPVRVPVEKSDESRVKDILVQKFEMNEVHSYIWCDGKKYKKLGIDVEDNVRILNIATPENGTLRNSMLPTLLTFAYENRKYADKFGIFEVGRTVCGTDENGFCNERRKLGIVMFSKAETEKELFLRAASTVRYIVLSLKHSETEFENIKPEHNWQHPKNTAKIYAGGAEIGVLCTLHPYNLGKIDKNAAVVCIEIDMEQLAAAKICDIEFAEPSKFPSVDFDLSVIMPCGKKYADAAKAWESEDMPELKDVKVIDIYEKDGEKSITLRFEFSLAERTLTGEEVQKNMNIIIERLKENGFSIKSE